jgi:hypothetical protein
MSPDAASLWSLCESNSCRWSWTLSEKDPIGSPRFCGLVLCHYKIPTMDHALACAASLVPCQEVLLSSSSSYACCLFCRDFEMIFSFSFNSLDNLTCANQDLISFPVDVMIGLFLLDAGMTLLCFFSFCFLSWRYCFLKHKDPNHSDRTSKLCRERI